MSSDFVGKMKCLERVSYSSGITMFTFLFSPRNKLTSNISENHVFMGKLKPIRKISSPISKLYKYEAILKFMMHSIQTFFSDYAVLWIITIDREVVLQFDISFIRIHGCYSWSQQPPHEPREHLEPNLLDINRGRSSFILLLVGIPFEQPMNDTSL